MMCEDYCEEEKSSSVMSPKVTKTDDGDDEVVNKLIHLMEKSTFTKTKFRRSEDIYRNRIRNDIKDLDVLSSDGLKSGYHYLYSRYEELWDYIWKMDRYVQNSLSCIKKHKLGHKDLSSALSKPFNVLSDYIYMKKNFEYHQIDRQQQLEKTIHFLDEIENVDELKDYYDFLRLRFMEFQKYTRMQEDRLQKCTDLLNENTSSFGEEGGEKKEVEVDDENVDEEYFKRSCSESSIPIQYENEGSEYDGFSYDRSTYEGQSSPMQDEASPPSPWPLKAPPLPAHHESQKSKIPRPPPPRTVVIPADNIKEVLQPIPGRVAPESKIKIFHEKLPNYNENAISAGYGKNTKRAPPSYMRKPSQVVLPPLQTTQHQSQQFSSNEECHEDFVQYDESLAIKRSTIKGIVKPNLIRKDLMKLRDPTVRPRGPKQTAVIAQELVAKSSIKCEQELKLPMIPQPPPRPNNHKMVNASVGSRIPRLPTIQQNNHVVSDVSRPCHPPQPPMKSQSRPRAFHRRYVTREAALPFPRMQ